ncbi:MATE family efflux transporter [Paenibacillus sp. HJGM_3]|uniref:MATE family efflux transporter n=1 Tax=Paenibacillus sp. HJGM_3 TaxID=3379816 RepID=UPI003859AD13
MSADSKPAEAPEHTATGRRQVSEAVLVDPNDGGAVRSKIFQLAGPTLTEMIMLNMTQMISMIMVGRLGANAVATVGLTSQPYLLMTVCFAALNMGTTVIVARNVGAGRHEEANRAAGQSLLLNAMLSVLLVILTVGFADDLLRLIGAQEEVVAYGTGYARISFAAIGFSAISSSLSSILRGAGDTRTPMRVNVLTGLASALLGFLLIYGHLGLPRLGVAGASLAVLIAQSGAMTAMLYVMFSGKFAVRLNRHDLFRFDRAMIGRMLKIGLPTSAEQLVMRLGITLFVMIAANLGTTAVAANQLLTNVIGLSFMPGMAFAGAASTLVGQALGVGKTELAERYAMQIRRYGMWVAGIMGALFVLFAPYILMLYTGDRAIIDEGTLPLRIVGLIQMSQASMFVLAGALRGAGETRYPLVSAVVGVWGVRVLLSLIFVYVFHWGMIGLWTAVACDQFARSLLIYRRFRLGRWKTIRI